MKKKMNNKGFSLVELIVVIAIMGVLVGIAAPQFLKYVESSRRATDVKNGQEIATVVQAGIADAKLNVDATGTGAVTVSDQMALADVPNPTTAADQLKSVLFAFFGSKGPDLKSKGATGYKVDYKIDGTIKISVIVSGADKEIFPKNEYQ